VLDVVTARVVSDRVQLAGAGVEFGVRGVPAEQRAVEVERPQGVQLGKQLVRQ
jgi:hypothetical protein